ERAADQRSRRQGCSLRRGRTRLKLGGRLPTIESCAAKMLISAMKCRTRRCSEFVRPAMDDACELVLAAGSEWVGGARCRTREERVMDLKLKDRKAIVTGGSKGIGRAIADALADEGCHVAICARDEAEVKAAVATLKKKGVNATGAAFDVRDRQALDAWVKRAGETLGGIDIAVANVSALD